MSKITAVRFTPSTLRCMIQDHVSLIDDAFYWQHITHVVYAGLNFDYGQVAVGPVHDDIVENLGPLTHPATYVAWLAELKRVWPHLQIVWSLPPFEDDDVLDTFDFSRVEHLAKVYGIDAIEINMQFIIKNKAGARKILREAKAVKSLKWWLVLPNIWTGLWTYGESGEFRGPPVDFIEVFVLNSYGYDGRALRLSPYDGSVSNWVIAMNLYGLTIPQSKVIIGIDTCGLHHDKKTGAIKPMPRHEIERKKGMMELRRSNVSGYSTLENSKEFIVYDDECILWSKMQLVHTMHIAGMVVSDLLDDTYRAASNSVWTHAVQFQTARILWA